MSVSLFVQANIINLVHTAAPLNGHRNSCGLNIENNDNTQKLQGGPQYSHRKRKHLNIKYLTEKSERATESASDFRNLIFQLPLLK